MGFVSAILSAFVFSYVSKWECISFCVSFKTMSVQHNRCYTQTDWIHFYNMKAKTKTKTKIHIDCDSLSLWFIVSQILTELYTRIGTEHNDWRSSILSSLYGLVECTSAKILLAVARVVLVVTSLLCTHLLCSLFSFTLDMFICHLFLFDALHFPLVHGSIFIQFIFKIIPNIPSNGTNCYTMITDFECICSLFSPRSLTLFSFGFPFRFFSLSRFSSWHSYQQTTFPCIIHYTFEQTRSWTLLEAI